MHKNYTIKAFTLGELMVGIAIVGIIALGISNIDFNRLSKNQESQIEVVKIINIIEETKNNALIGRGVDSTLENPINWSISINNSTSSGSIISRWELESGTVGTGSTWKTKDGFSISNLHCRTINPPIDNDTPISSGSIIYQGSNASLNGCSDDTYKMLVFNYGASGSTSEISINTVTGVIEKN